MAFLNRCPSPEYKENLLLPKPLVVGFHVVWWNIQTKYTTYSRVPEEPTACSDTQASLGDILAPSQLSFPSILASWSLKSDRIPVSPTSCSYAATLTLSYLHQCQLPASLPLSATSHPHPAVPHTARTVLVCHSSASGLSHRCFQEPSPNTKHGLNSPPRDPAFPLFQLIIPCADILNSIDGQFLVTLGPLWAFAQAVPSAGNP